MDLAEKTNGALDGDVALITAIARSCWEDLHDQRRRMLAGRMSARLDMRLDATQNRLLTEFEEAKLRQGRMKGGLGKPAYRPFLQGPRQYAEGEKPTHNPRFGGGKGKSGRGRE